MWPRSWPRPGAGSFPPASEKVASKLCNFYEHDSRAGNRADVWKHFLLLSTLDLLVGQGALGEAPFRYLETHCGKGLYLLGEARGWKEAIGKTTPLAASLARHPYFRMLGLPKGQGAVYLGSWLLVALHLQSQGIEFRMSLYDVSPEVGKHLLYLGASEKPGAPIRFILGDGFGALGSQGLWDLVLVDPPFSPDFERDRMECTKAPGELEKRSKAFLIWYPLRSEEDPGLDAGGTCQALEITWGNKEKASSMVGCGVLVGGLARGLPWDLFPTLELLAKRLEAEFRWRTA